jgi:Transcription elongation factor, GreA/GreB, C-term
METPTIIMVGCHVELNLLDDNGRKDRLSIDIVADESADFSHGFLGASTPLAKALVGEKTGTVIPYLQDDIFAIEIISVVPAIIHPPKDAQEKRQEKINKATREVEHTNAVVFASSFSGKWGDYDPDSLPTDEKSKEDKPGE